MIRNLLSLTLITLVAFVLLDVATVTIDWTAIKEWLP